MRVGNAVQKNVVADLIDIGLVEETGSQGIAIGGPRILLSFVPQTGYVLGAELTDQECRVILTDIANFCHVDEDNAQRRIE